MSTIRYRPADPRPIDTLSPAQRQLLTWGWLAAPCYLPGSMAAFRLLHPASMPQLQALWSQVGADLLEDIRQHGPGERPTDVRPSDAERLTVVVESETACRVEAGSVSATIGAVGYLEQRR